MTAKMLLEQYMAERHALGFVSKTDEGCIRRFLRDYKEPEDGKIVFSKEYVLEHIGTGLNQKANTVLRDVSAINGFLNFVIRKGFTAYKIPPKSMPKEVRNFRAYIYPTAWLSLPPGRQTYQSCLFEWRWPAGIVRTVLRSV